MKFINSLSLFKLTCWSMSRKFASSKMFHVKVFAAGIARWKCSSFVRGGRGPTIWSDGGGKTNARDRSIFVFIIYLYCIKSLNFIHWYCNVAVKHVLLYLSIYKILLRSAHNRMYTNCTQLKQTEILVNDNLKNCNNLILFYLS